VNYTFTDQEDDDETGLYNYRARLYDPLLGRFISADSIVPEPGNLQAFNRYSYCVNNPLVYVDPSGHFFGTELLIAVAVTALIGAAAGATVAAVNGTDIGMGALTGAISGAGVYLGGIPGGALAGVINASITGDDLGQGALWGAVGAGAGILAGYGVGQLNIGNPYVQFGVSMTAGGLVSGGISSLAGGDFVQGFQNGAIGAAAGYFASMGISKILKQSPANTSPGKGDDRAICDLTQGGEQLVKTGTGTEWKSTPETSSCVFARHEYKFIGGEPIGFRGNGFFCACYYEVKWSWYNCFNKYGQVVMRELRFTYSGETFTMQVTSSNVGCGKDCVDPNGLPNFLKSRKSF